MTAIEGTQMAPPKSRKPFFVRMGVLCAALLAYAALKPSPMSDLAFAFGYFLTTALVVSVITFAVSRGAREEKGLVFACIVGSLLLGNYVGVLRERGQANRFLDEVQSATQSYTQQALADPESAPKPVELKPVIATTKGDVGTAEVIVKQMLNDFAADHNAYLAEIQAVGWYTLLDAKRLKTDASLEDSWSIVKGAERIAQKYQQRSFDMIDAMSGKVKQANFQSERMRDSMLRGLQTSLPKSRQNAKELWDLELSAVDEMRAIVQLLDRRRGHYQVTDTQVLFQADEDLTAFNKHIEAVNEIGRLQQAMQRRMQEEGAKTLEQTRAGL